MNNFHEIDACLFELDIAVAIRNDSTTTVAALEGIGSALWDLIKKVGSVIKKLIVKLLTWLGFIKKKANDAIPVFIREMKMSVSTAVYGETETNIKNDIGDFIKKADDVISQSEWLPRFEKLTKLAKRRVELMQMHPAINKSVTAYMDKVVENYHRGAGTYIGVGGSPKEISTRLDKFCPAADSFITSRINLIDLILEVADPKTEFSRIHDSITTRQKLILEKRSGDLSLNNMIRFEDADEKAKYLDNEMTFTKFVIERPNKQNRILRTDITNFNLMMDSAYRSAGLVEKLIDTITQGVDKMSTALENIPSDKAESIIKAHSELNIKQQDTAFPETIKSLVINYSRLLGKEVVEIAKAGEEIRSYYLAITQYPVKV